MTLPCVLLVDDESDMLDCLELALSDEYRTLLAHGGAEAMRLLGENEVDAVVLDLMMPEVDGFAVMRDIAARGMTVPVIIASAMPELQATARACQAADWIAKPYLLDALRSRLRRMLPSGGRATRPPEQHLQPAGSPPQR